MASWPYTNQAIDLTQYARLFGRMHDSGVLGPLGSGTQLITTATGASMGISVSAGFAIVRGHALYNTTATALTIAASGASQRIDSVVARLDPAQPDTTKLVLAVVTGGAVAPTLVQTEVGIYELEIARVTVPASVVVIQQANLTDTRTFLGTNVRAWTTATRPAGALGVFGWNNTTALWEGWNGTAFVSVSPTPTWASVTGKPATFAPIVGVGVADAKAGNWVPAWPDVTGKPLTFAPIVGTGAADAKPGNWMPAWAEVTGKPTSFTPGAHDINGATHTGTLGIDAGGTGATTATAALNALGIYVQSTQPAYAAGRVWIKIP